MKQKELSVMLRVIVILVAACVAFLAVVLISGMVAMQEPGMAVMITFLCVTLIPVAAALVTAWNIFADIGRDRSFTALNAARLRRISRLALLDTVLYILCGAVRIITGQLHVEVYTIAFIVVLGFGVTVASAALSHLTQKAADMKAENDLTI
jgi:hypothetical protein